MKRGFHTEDVARLFTLVNTSKSLDLLGIYVEKITNKKSTSLKFIPDFDAITLDLLFISLKLMSNKPLTGKDLSKFDKDELNYYLSKEHGLNYFKQQSNLIKNESDLIVFIQQSLSQGDYVCNINNTVKLANQVIVDAYWLIDFANFVVDSINMIEYLNDNRTKFLFKTVEFPKEKKENLKIFLKQTKVYEYVITKKNKAPLKFDDVKKIYSKIKKLDNYDFEVLKELNSDLAKDYFVLSVNKVSLNIKNSEKRKLENLYNELSEITDVILEYIKEILAISLREKVKNRIKLLDQYELLRSLAHAYKNNYTLKECRKLFDFDDDVFDISLAMLSAKFFVYYIYDEKLLKENYYYEELLLDGLKPATIDYETVEYKNILDKLSNLNKRVVAQNRKINKLLELGRCMPKNCNLVENNSRMVGIACQELELLVNKVGQLRKDLEVIKDENHARNNINRTKVSYIKEALDNGNYRNFDDRIVLFCYSPKDNHKTFHLNMNVDDFCNILFNKYNMQVRMNFYQK